MPSILKKNLEGDYKLLLSWQYNKVEFLGLPSLKEDRPLTLEEIYVPLSFIWESGGKGERFYLPAALEASRRLVVLGDPGCGKSTLVKVITHSFGRTETTPLSSRFGPLMPVPIILRDYRVRDWKTEEDMLSDFISQLDEEIRDQITVEWLLAPLREGRGFLLIDGLDEVGSPQDRSHLRNMIINPLLARMPESYAILTSRIVGYDDVPFGGSFFSFATKQATSLNQQEVSSRGIEDNHLVLFMPETALDQQNIPSIRRCYVAPFNQEDIEQFIARWYAAREPDTELRRIGAESLDRALKQNDRIMRLASNPSLLTLMALIHRVTAHLPSGRVKLYDKIVEAYLETIQTYRKLGQYPASLDQIKRWLARVGWEMQTRRAKDEESELLVPRDEVLMWLREAIAIDRESPDEEAVQFLDYVARRSGLLIPRGPDQFSFVHLTFQEYFAAFHLRGQVSRFDLLAAECARLVKEQHWHETLSLLFELLAEFPGAGDDLLGELIDKAESDADIRRGAAELFSALLLDEQNGLSLNRQKDAAELALRLVCDYDNQSVIEKLKKLPPERFDQWIIPWMDEQLAKTAPENFGRDFFVMGYKLLKDWPQRLEELVIQRGDLPWNEEQIEVLAIAASENVGICNWVVQRLPLVKWLSPKPIYFFDNNLSVFLTYTGLTEIKLLDLIVAHNQSSQHRLLTQLGLAVAISGSQVIKRLPTILTLAEGQGQDKAFDWVEFLFGSDVRPNQSRILVQALVKTRAQSRARSQARAQMQVTVDAQTRELEIMRMMVGFFGQTVFTDLALFLARDMAAATSLPSPERSEIDSEITKAIATAEWLFFSPDVPSDEFNSTIKSLRQLAEAKDDWSRLLALSSLLLLGAGTPEMCAERNELLDKGILRSKEFTFPKELHPETETDEFRKELPEVLRIAFLHDPEDPWLVPEIFDPSNPDSRFFLSTPREFFAIAAEALDPEGETDLAKWRKVK